MNKLYADAGTTWSKIILVKNTNNLVDNSFIEEKYLVKETETKAYYILPSSCLRKKELNFCGATGHMASISTNTELCYTNEVIALAKGVKKLNLEDEDLTVLDLGSRDVKWVKFQNGKFKDLDWNSSCASATGATVEMLLKFYDIKPQELEFNQEKYNITCGIFGLEKIMDDIAKGEKPKKSVAKFIHGLAYNAWMFTGKADKIYLSGGFCDNKCFVDSLSQYCKTVILGRFVLAEGIVE